MTLWDLIPAPQFTATPRLIRGYAGGHDQDEQPHMTPEERAAAKVEANKKYLEAKKKNGATAQEIKRLDRIERILNYLATTSYDWPVTENQIKTRCNIPRTTGGFLLEHLRLEGKVNFQNCSIGKVYWRKK